MKKHFYLFILLFAATTVKAQNVPNGGFENWTSYNSGAYSFPDFWRTTDSAASLAISGQHSVIQEVVNVHSGGSAMKMQSWTYIAFTLPGAATNGNLNSSFQFVGGSADSVRYDMLTGWYEYSPVGGDSCTITASFSKWNGTSRDIVGGGAWSTATAAASYTPFSMPITYALSENPDTVLIIILSAPFSASHSGTVLYVDDLNFTGINSTNDLPKNSFSINAYPNPASDFLIIEATGNLPLKSSVSILDMTGKMMQSAVIVDKKQRIDISGLSSGNYFYNLVDDRGTKLYSGKFSVSH